MNNTIKEMLLEAKEIQQDLFKRIKVFEKKYKVALKPSIRYVGDPKHDNTKLNFHIYGNIKDLDPEMEFASGFSID